ncbi:MAG: DUF421 domain-containing protein [Sphingomonadaceae bacterium]
MMFDSWTGLGRVLVSSIIAYLVLIVILRLSGKRTLAKMNAFDLVVTVALGSTLATILLNKDVALAEGIFALLALVLLQYGIAALSVRYRIVESMAKSSPSVLLRDGKINDDKLIRERVTREEVHAAIRSAGIGDVSAVAAVVLETDGTFSVIPQDNAGSRSAFPPPKKS